MTELWQAGGPGTGLTTRRTILKGAFGAVAAVSGLTLAGCGGGSSSEVKIVNTSATGALAVEKMIDDLGYFKHLGVSPKTTNVQTGSDVVAALASGSADLTMLSGLIGIMPALEKGLSLKLVGGTEVVSTSAVFTADPKIRSISDLKGASIGVGAIGSELYDVFVALLAKAGISKDDVTFRNVGTSADSFKAAIAKQIDVGYGQVGDEALAKAHGARMITTVNEALPKWINQGAVASQSAIAHKRSGLIAVMTAYGRLFKYLTTSASREKYVAAYVASGGTQATGALEWEFINQTTAYSPAFTLPEDKVNFIQEQNVRAGSQKKVLPMASCTDLSFAKAAAAKVSSV